MASALVVDDSLVDQRLAGHALRKGLGLTVVYASNGLEALAIVQRQPPDVIVTDMQMPGMDGLELIEAVRRQYPTLPVVIMTAVGSEELAAAALRGGANSYVPKRHLADDLADVVRRQFATASQAQERTPLKFLQEIRAQFLLDNDSAHIAPLVRYLKEDLARIGLFSETTVMRVGAALEEALTNAIEHGNLGVETDLQDRDPQAAAALLQQRRVQAPYCDRRVHVLAELTPEQVRYVIRDQGEGFDTSRLPDPSDPAALDQCQRRGLLLIHAFMDQVFHNPAGNQITMIKRPDHLGAAAGDAA